MPAIASTMAAGMAATAHLSINTIIELKLISKPLTITCIGAGGKVFRPLCVVGTGGGGETGGGLCGILVTGRAV